MLENKNIIARDIPDSLENPTIEVEIMINFVKTPEKSKFVVYAYYPGKKICNNL